MARIDLERVRKVFAGGIVAVDDITLTVDDGEFLVLVGPSGCGKTTLLRMIAGLESSSAGGICIDGRDVTGLAPRHRDVAMVFQGYALYPHKSVRDNLSFGLRQRKVPKADISIRVQSVAEMLGLEELLDRRPRALSGGQRQRVAMGRAIVREPAAFLMDEPLSNLDAQLRVSMRSELARLHERLGTTTVYVTHDQVEAMTLGQRVAVMRDGKIQQVDTPQRLYREPANLFVAAFIGSPAMNLVEATFQGESVAFGSETLPLDPARQPAVPSGTRVVLGIRPEAFESSIYAHPSLPSLEVEVEVVEELGADTHVLFRMHAESLARARALGDERLEQDSIIVRDQAVLFNGRIDSRSGAGAGVPLTLRVDPARFYFFDPVTGANLCLDRSSQSQTGYRV